MKIANDQQGMALALEWAAKGMFITAPNPRVGCVVVRDGIVLGAGHTQAVGQAHAEIQALADAQSCGNSVTGATLYVTLEPCSHHGRTPPCADAIIRAGVARVVSAIADPNPLVAGAGLERLRAAGIAVTTEVLRDAALEMNIGFFSRMQSGKPWVRMKAAASLDGKTALHNGASQWITAAPARDDGHAWRARACAVLTGIGTVKADDPQLTVRAVATPRQPRRIVIDSRLEIDLQARILQDAPVWVVCAQADPGKQAVLESLGHEVICLPNAAGKVDLPGLMRELGRRQINELHVEAGFKLNGSLLREGCVDELLLYLAPSLIGDAQGLFDLPALTSLSGKTVLAFHDVKQIGPDLRILARLT
ncbi:bifunctional diaminohydroxyphosphoribosylaminopyrimidine deaminase/5-amino-6-(5-phosphoribosylamino)uracil reductase RibD [Actimicrobium sp. CCC2.4]|uniref:bifunctional diaminohydroxyphosphoribosylaminopyrimidine deaminase/5-amino-6-(5-phosphoribosylamino)uracil reductase RibD n=1 Tax=Actimicrobium sp. CCC2.4 TaxID=3048606 RepID=UPI002AC9DA32|nr:bifunctional diaminohydroxyphosphoribosylaminopyrimidine deaminase/5-amino-6-(5-phosphoribosylamino)uracil reductase RibD [Actimicrobium sp. CCC2.4]MEB0137308.1 bifunctional diaminohydroxyphosphoribosylaminopyrimidine deaminase/5-amino-6-(5-phosphoribosylamino)uracil reductase RibD [Actimicrobium sp. CCC2.4]WPX31801.1 bifunctional diaminohydroxyphosphoribosylaminopyrimidine deaminase/5-amino-6-(5-phosphoribosylamino)uracil reductase RibD [Actimicrobium sp. CCC2.4]